MKIITVVSDVNNYGYNNFLKPSCFYHNHDLAEINTNKSFRFSLFYLAMNKFFSRPYGNQIKDVLFLRYIHTLHDEDLVLLTDGYDTLVLAGPHEIREKWAGFGKPLVISAERNCWPDATLKGLFPDEADRPNYLNGGGILGKVGDLKDALGRVNRIKVPNKYRWSSQYRWTRYLLDNRDRIGIDHNSEIFFCAATPGEEQGSAPWQLEYWRDVLIRDKRIRLPHGTTPAHIHFNGKISAIMPDFLHAFPQLCPWASTPCRGGS